MNLSEYIHRRLRAVGVRRAFGVPGSFIMPLWQQFTGDPDVVLARHETGAVFMADGWSRATRGLGVALVTIGPGVTNSVTGVASAYRDSIPLLLISGQAPTATFGRGAFLESVDLDRSAAPQALLRPVTKRSIEIVDSANGAYLFDTALDLALAGRPGPVHLSVPVDLQLADVGKPVRPLVPEEESWAAPAPAQQSVPDAHAVPDAARRLAEADRPLLLVGWGSALSAAADEITPLAEAVGALVVTTTKAVSCLPSQPRLLGHLGPGQRSDLLPLLRDYRPDVVLVLGASLSQYYAQALAEMLENASVIRIDIDADQLRLRATPAIALHGDVASVVGQLRAALPDRTSRSAGIPSAVAAFHARRTRAVAAQPRSYRAAPSMAGFVAHLVTALPDEAVVVPDAGNHWLDVLALHRPARAGGLQLNCGLGPMGWAIGAAVGMALAGAERTIVCVTGDGSMLMHGAELSVAAEHDADLLVLVFNNRSHGRVRLGQRLDLDGRIVATDIPPIDFVAWMGAMGIAASKVATPQDVEGRLAAALAMPGTRAIEIDCDPDEVPGFLRNWIEDAP